MRTNNDEDMGDPILESRIMGLQDEIKKLPQIGKLLDPDPQEEHDTITENLTKS